MPMTPPIATQLFKKMTQQFDAGGAKGMLLNNLSVHGAAVQFNGEIAAFQRDDTALDDVTVDLSVAAKHQPPNGRVFPLCRVLP